MSYFEHRSSVLEDRWGKNPQGWYGHQDQCRREANRKLLLVFSVREFIWPSSSLGVLPHGEDVVPYGNRRDIDRGLLSRTGMPWESPGKGWVDNFDGTAQAVGLAKKIHNFKLGGGELTYEALLKLVPEEDIDSSLAYDRLGLLKEGVDWERIKKALLTP